MFRAGPGRAAKPIRALSDPANFLQDATMADNREIAELATAFLPAIEKLRVDLANLERQAAETRMLIQQLCARAGIAADPPDGGITAIPASARRVPVTTRGPHARRRHSPRASRPGAAKPTKAPAKPGNGVDELAKIVAEIAASARLVAAATRAKDAEQLRAAIAARARVERRGGTMLIAMAGKKPLPGVSKIESRRWRRVALLVPDEFEARIERATRKALAGGAAVAAPEKVTARAVRSKSSVAAAPRPTMNLTPWKTEADGSLSRTLSAEVDGEAARSTAGA
jgi:hypothetical protein